MSLAREYLARNPHKLARREAPILVQVKRRADLSSAESVETVRSLHGVMLREGTPRGMVVTTAQKFSPAALRETEALSAQLRHYEMQLRAFADVTELLQLPSGRIGKPWDELGVELGTFWPCESPWVDKTVASEIGIDLPR